MDRIDCLQLHVEALEQQTEQLKQHTQALETHTHTITRRLRWWRGRLGTSVWTVGVAVGVVVALLLGAPTVGTADGGDDGSPCEGLHGVCFGLCTAADALGCLDDEHDQPLIKHVCRKIEKQLKKFDCEIPPPLVTCPCEGLSDGVIVWDDTFNPTQCFESVSPDGSAGTRLIAGNPGVTLGTGTSAPNMIASCNVRSSPSGAIFLSITFEEFEACADSLRQIAANDGVTCQ